MLCGFRVYISSVLSIICGNVEEFKKRKDAEEKILALTDVVLWYELMFRVFEDDE